MSLRKEGFLADYRSAITHREKETPELIPTEGMVTIKLFNQLAGELGTLFLKRGLWLSKDDTKAVLKNRFDKLRSSIINIEKDGLEITPDQLAGLNWSEVPEKVLLKAIF